MNTKSTDNVNTHPPTIASLILEDLGYCCLWAFFKKFGGRPSLIAARLGFTPRAVRRVKAYTLEHCTCAENHRCMRKALGLPRPPT